jgi:HEAT repeat protein
MKQFINPILRLGTAIALLSVIYMQNDEIKELKEKSQIIENVAPLAGDIKITNQIDSLQSELFVQQTIVTRYETALELLKEEDKKAADKFELILTTQTE